ncbi:flippase [Candidatus Gracilibacteria bacterium]|nr:flippase [Candidatus Gracilibacteria bacterium]
MYRKIASNTIAQIASKAITAFISIFLIGILTKYLPIEMYGNYNKIYSYLGIFAFLADLGLYTITIREISRKPKDIQRIVGNVLTLRAGLGLLVWILAFMIALGLPGYHDSLTLIAIFIVGGFTLVSLINSSLLALMQSQMKMEFSLISVVSGKLVNIGLICIFLLLVFTDVTQTPQAFIGVFIAGFAGIVLNTYMNYVYAKRIIPIKFLFEKEYIKHIFKISLPYGLALFLSVVYFKIDIILLSLLEVPEKANISIALYGLPMKIIEVLMVLGGFYLNSILPSLSKKFTEKKSVEISHMLGMSLKILISFAMLIFIMGNLFAHDIIGIIATPQYLDPVGHIYNSAGALSITLGVLLFHFISLAFIYMLIASERQGILLWVNSFVAIINVIGNLLLIPHYSFIGAAVVTLLSQIILMSICGYIVLKTIKIPRIYIINIIYTLGISIGVFYIFLVIKKSLEFSSLWNVLLLAPMMFLTYIALELIISRKILKANT